MNLFLSVFTMCMLNTVEYASSVEIKSPWRLIHHDFPASRTQLKRFLNALIIKQNDLDSRILALSWIESRIRLNIRRGDKGRACGTFQIHARYSYPMFTRPNGFVNWSELDEYHSVKQECKRLENIKYSVKIMKKYLSLMDKKQLHACHHNSGFYGRCNPWYKKRLDYWTSFFSFAKTVCSIKSKINEYTHDP